MVEGCGQVATRLRGQNVQVCSQRCLCEMREGEVQNQQSRFSRCPGAQWQASSGMARLCGLCPRTWSALRPAPLTQTAGGAEPGACRGTRRGPRHPSNCSPVFKGSSLYRTAKGPLFHVTLVALLVMTRRIGSALASVSVSMVSDSVRAWGGGWGGAGVDVFA